MDQAEIGWRRDRWHYIGCIHQLFRPQSVRGILVSGMHRQWCANANIGSNLLGLISSSRQRRKRFDREQSTANVQEKTIKRVSGGGGGGGKSAAASGPMPATAAAGAGAVVEGVDGVDTVGMAAYKVGATGEV